MKKLYLILTAVTALSLVTLSCTKELADPSQQEQIQKEEDPAKDAGEEQTIPEGMISLTFGVSQEGDAAASDEDTKTSWDGTTHAWSEGDMIRIFWGTGSNEYVDAEVKDNKVTAVVGDADKYYAVYPSTGAFAFREGGTIDFGISNQQSGSFKDANMMAAMTSKEAATLNFKNLTHIFKFHLTNDSPYDQFQFCTNNGSIVVNTYGVSFDSEGNVTIGTRTVEISGYSNSKYVRLHSGMTPGADYYFAVVPGADYSLGFGLQARLTGETGSYSVSVLTKGSIDTSDRCKITNLGNLDSFIHADWFITADGNGDGPSWDNPGGPALLRNLLVMPSTFTTEQSKKNFTFRLHNAKIHLKEGTYNFQTILADTGVKQFGSDSFHSEVDNVTVIEGGYPSSASGKDLSGYDPKNHPSIIISNQAEANDRAIYFNGARLYDLTFKGLSFANNPSGENFNTPGGAVAINGTTNGTIKFEDCSFTLKSTNTGGALSFRGTKELNAEFKNCTFSSCESSKSGGAIWINTTNHNLVFDRCTITGNTTSVNGGFLYNQNSGTVTIKNTTISNNTANSESGLGGAIYGQTSGTINIENCVVNGNSASKGGAICNTVNLNVIGSSFSANNANDGSAILNAAGTSTNQVKAVIFNSSFISNVAAAGKASSGTPGGGCISGDSNDTILIANSTFKDNTCLAGGVLVMNNSTNNNLYIVSSTVSGSQPAITRTHGIIRVFNSLMPGTGEGTTTNIGIDYSIYKSATIDVYGASTAASNGHWAKHTVDGFTDITFGLGTFDKGVFPLDANYETAYSQGMSVENLQALTFNNITLTDEQKALLAQDQKGNDRTEGIGTIMGAYVKTTAPTE